MRTLLNIDVLWGGGGGGGGSRGIVETCGISERTQKASFTALVVLQHWQGGTISEPGYPVIQ